MRKLLNTLYVLSEDVYLTLDGENVAILREKDTLGRFPLHNLENIVAFTYKGASPALMGACAQRNISLSFLSPKGKFWARSIGPSHGNVLLRKEQYRISDDEQRSCTYARNMITGKIFNCRWSLERTARDNGIRVDIEKIKQVSTELNDGLKKIRQCESLEALRGIEGELASRYFSVFDELILNQKEEFHFSRRNRRPPLDNVNALLSFAYTVLGNECAGALEAIGLDAYVGFLHQDRPGRQSLALDLMEELRGILADRLVLTMINRKMINEEHFVHQSDGAVLLNDKGRKAFFSFWQNHKKEKIMHPFLKEKIEWGLVPYVQSMLLARTVRGDLEEYPPFLWK